MSKKNAGSRRKLNFCRVALIVCLLAVTFANTIGGTVAYMKDSTGEVVNSFKLSGISIYMQETVNGTTMKTSATAGVTNDTFRMVPGQTLDKDPEVVVEAGNEACYVFVKIDRSANFDAFMSYEIASGWNSVDGVDDVYYRIQPATDADVEIQVLKDDQVTVNTDVTKADMNALTTGTYPRLTFTAYAVQQYKTNSSMFTAEEAWDLASGAAQ